VWWDGFHCALQAASSGNDCVFGVGRLVESAARPGVNIDSLCNSELRSLPAVWGWPSFLIVLLENSHEVNPYHHSVRATAERKATVCHTWKTTARERACSTSGDIILTPTLNEYLLQVLVIRESRATWGWRLSESCVAALPLWYSGDDMFRNLVDYQLSWRSTRAWGSCFSYVYSQKGMATNGMGPWGAHRDPIKTMTGTPST